MWKKTLLTFLAWRLWLVVISLLAASLIVYRPHNEFTHVNFWTSTNTLNWQSLSLPWANFDGVHYLNIASRGYTTDGRFLPLFPMILSVVPNHLIWSLVFNHLLLFLILVLSSSSLVFLLPTSFFLVSTYSETLFIALTLLTFYFLRKDRWFSSLIPASLLTITRLPGIFIILSLLIYLWRQYLNQKTKHLEFRREIFKKLCSLILVPLPLLAYAYFNFMKWGNAFYFLKAHTDLGNSRTIGLIFPLQTIYRYLKILLFNSYYQPETWVALLELATLLAVIFIIYLGVKQKVNLELLIFSILSILLPIMSGTLSGLPRYSLCLIPLILQIDWSKYHKYQIIYLLLALILQAILTAAFLRGYFIA